MFLGLLELRPDPTAARVRFCRRSAGRRAEQWRGASASCGPTSAAQPPAPPARPARAAEQSRAGGLPAAGIGAPTSSSRGAPVSEQAPGRAAGAGGRGFLSAPTKPLHAVRTASFCCVCTCANVRARALVRPCAGRRRRSVEKPGLFLLGWLARPGLGGRWGLPDTGLPGRGPRRSQAPSPSEMANFVSGFWALKECLPDSWGR